MTVSIGGRALPPSEGRLLALRKKRGTMPDRKGLIDLFLKGLVTCLIGFLAYRAGSFGLGLTVYTAREDDPLVSVRLLVTVLGNGLMVGGPVFFWVVVPIARFLMRSPR
jgi:hypothetical protein